MDLNVLVLLGGRERTQEYQRLFEAAGFRLERVITTQSPFSEEAVDQTS